MTIPLLAAFWGGLAGAALLLGSLMGYYLPMRRRTVAAVMAFGSGVLISALSFELMEEAYAKGGFAATAAGFLGGAVIYTAANLAVGAYGAKHRKRSGTHQAEEGGSGIAIAIGALIDGIPESIVIGLSLLGGQGVSIVAVAAVFISNIPEGLSSSVGMKKAGRGKTYIFGIWMAIALLSALAALCGCLFFEHAAPALVSFAQAIAAGAILAMIADTMIPEAFEEAHDFAGLITVFGFLAAFALDKVF